MKYVVEVKYTNPAHEHVSLRRRVDTVNRLVEAADADEAINRVTRQQRALGFIIREAKVLETEPKETEKEKEEVVDKKTLDKEEDTKMSAAKGGAEKAAMKEEAEQIDEAGDPDKREAGYKMPPHLKAAQAKSDALSKVQKPVQAGTLAAIRRRAAMQKEEAAKEPAKALVPTPAQNPNQKTTLSPSNPNVQKDDKLKEAADPGKTRVVNKKVKAAEKMINAAKGKVNKVNFEPTADIPATHSHALSLRQQ